MRASSVAVRGGVRPEIGRCLTHADQPLKRPMQGNTRAGVVGGVRIEVRRRARRDERECPWHVLWQRSGEESVAGERAAASGSRRRYGDGRPTQERAPQERSPGNALRTVLRAVRAAPRRQGFAGAHGISPSDERSRNRDWQSLNYTRGCLIMTFFNIILAFCLDNTVRESPSWIRSFPPPCGPHCSPMPRRRIGEGCNCAAVRLRAGSNARHAQYPNCTQCLSARLRGDSIPCDARHSLLRTFSP